MNVPGLRSDRETVGGIVLFGRTLDKVRLHAEGRLPSDYYRGPNCADGRICRFLRIDYDALAKKALEEKDDVKVLEWCYENGRRLSEDDVKIFNAFLTKRGCNDEFSAGLKQVKEQLGISHRDDIQTFFDIHDFEEGRK